MGAVHYLLLILCVQAIVFGQHPGAIDPADFQHQVMAVANKVPEFRWIARTAQSYGLRVWLFGGSAASFAHYVKENMLFEHGSDEYYGESFAESEKGERSYFDIFRPTQG